MSDISTTPSGLTGAGGGNKLRIAGMATGLDVDGMVKKMMAAEQVKVDKVKQAQQVIQWKKDAYNDIIKDIKDLQSSFFDSSSSDKNILSSANFAGFDTSIVSGNNASISAVGTGVQVGSYKVRVDNTINPNEKLATKASIIGSITDGTNKTLSTTLLNLGLQPTSASTGYTNPTTNWNNKKIGFSINGGATKDVTVTTGTDIAGTVTNINTEINKNTDLQGKVKAIEANGKIQFQALTDSSVKITNSTDVGTDLDNLKDKFINSYDDSFNITYNGTTQATIKVSTTDKISDVISKINSATSGAVTASFSQLTGKFTLQSANTGASQKIAISNGANSTGEALSKLGITELKDSTHYEDKSNIINSYTDANWNSKKIGFSIDGVTKEITLDTATKSTLADRVTDINAQINKAGSGLEGKIKAIITSDKRIQFVTDSNVKIVNPVADDSYVIDDLDNLDGKYISLSKSGQDATVTITPPGATTGTTVTKSTNNFTIDGINYNLTGTGETTVSVTQNNNKVYDKVKTFLDKYNAIVDKIQTKLNEKKDLAYKPLTDTQKSSMKEADITSWESKAKQGILKSDDNLKNLLNNLKTSFSTAVTGTGISMGKYGDSSIGLDFSTDYQKPAHIDIVDATKLKAAISSKGEQILKFFTNTSTASDATTANNESGVFSRIKSILQDNVGFVNTTLNTAILTKYANKQDDFSSTGSSGTSTLSNQIYQKQLLINQLDKSLSDKQESYYQKFAKLESAMNNLNSQQTYLSQQLG